MSTSKNYYCMLFSIMINNIGDAIFDLFIAWKVTTKSGNVMNSVYLIGSSLIFRAIIALFIGILTDRKNKKHLIIFSNISSSVIILIFFLCFSYAISNLWLGLFFILLNDFNNEVFSRSYISLSAELLSTEKYIKFQSVYTIAVRIINIFGSAMVGFLIAFLPDIAVFGMDILTFVFSAIFTCVISYQYVPNTAKRQGKRALETTFHSLLENIKAAFLSILHSAYLRKFVLVMFILNLAYGFIPYILPIIIATKFMDSILLGFIKAAMSVGEVAGLVIVNRKGAYVSRLFKLGLLGCLFSMGFLAVVSNASAIAVLFLLYGAFDSLTQPLFSYTVSSIEDKDRGKILGGIDAIILFSPSIGMYLGTRIMQYQTVLGYVFMMLIFLTALIVIQKNGELNHVFIKK